MYHYDKKYILCNKTVWEIKPPEKRPIVYFLINNEEIVYVGKSLFGVQRIFAHKDKIFSHYFIQDVPEKCLDEYENYYITLFQPKYNKTLNWEANCISIKKIQSFLKENYKEQKYYNLRFLKKKIFSLNIEIKDFKGIKWITKEEFKEILKHIED